MAPLLGKRAPRFQQCWPVSRSATVTPRSRIRHVAAAATTRCSLRHYAAAAPIPATFLGFPVIDSSQPVPGHQERSEVFDVVPFPARAFLLRFRRSLSDRFTRGRNAFHSPHGRNLRTGPCKRAITAPNFTHQNRPKSSPAQPISPHRALPHLTADPVSVDQT